MNTYEHEEFVSYLKRVEERANEFGQTVKEYLQDSAYRYVIVSDGDAPMHWWNPDDKFDESDYCVYETRREAVREMEDFASRGDDFNRIMTERGFLRSKGITIKALGL